MKAIYQLFPQDHWRILGGTAWTQGEQGRCDQAQLKEKKAVMRWVTDALVSLMYWARIVEQTRSWQIVYGAWTLGARLWVWFVMGLAITSAIATFLSPASLAKSLQRMQGLGVLFAAILGVISPLATYSVIPLAVIMLRQGAPLAPVAAFMISSPLINPGIFAMTAGGMGLGMAVARMVASFTLAIVGGWLAGRCEKRWGQPAAYLRQQEALPVDVPLRHYRKSLDGLRSGRFQGLLQGKESARSWLYNFGMQIKFAGRYFLLALVVSAAVRELISPSLIMRVFGASSRFSILLAAAAGIPLYACGGAAIPLMQVLTEMGMSPGAVLAFFLTGPATNISTVLILGTLFQANFLTLYYSVALGGAIIAGYVYQWLAIT